MTILSAMLHSAIEPALALLPQRMDSEPARLLLLAIGLQESEFETRFQNNNTEGPALGFWQFEKAGGVRGVMTHPASEQWAHSICAARDVDWDERAAWRALAQDDIFAAAFARLLLWTDRKPLPAVEDVEGAWSYYTRNWRPGKPHPRAWPNNHAAACLALAAEDV